MIYNLRDSIREKQQALEVWGPIFRDAAERGQRRSPEFRRALTGWKFDRRRAR